MNDARRRAAEERAKALRARHPGQARREALPHQRYFAANTLDRSFTAASRGDRGANPNRCSIVARIEVVSCCGWSTTKSPRRNGEITSAGTHCRGLQMALGLGWRRRTSPGRQRAQSSAAAYAGLQLCATPRLSKRGSAPGLRCAKLSEQGTIPCLARACCTWRRDGVPTEVSKNRHPPAVSPEIC